MYGCSSKGTKVQNPRRKYMSKCSPSKDCNLSLTVNVFIAVNCTGWSTTSAHIKLHTRAEVSESVRKFTCGQLPVVN